MNRKFTLPTLFTVCALALSNFSFANLITYNGGPVSDYPLNNNDTLFIASGTYTGKVSGLNSNTITIIVANGATFQPNQLAPTNGVVCKMHIYGTFNYTPSLTTNTNFTIDVWAGGIVNLTAMNTKGKDQVWTNHIGGTLNFSGDVLVNGGVDDDRNAFINYETVNVTGNFQMNSGSSFINYKNMSITGTVLINGGTYNNYGKFETTGLIRLNNGASVIHNYCRMITSGSIQNTSGNLYNHNYIHAGGDVENSGSIFNVPVFNSIWSIPIIQGTNFLQSGNGINGNGILTGSGNLYFTGTTTQTGGNTGTAGITSDTLKMYDLSRGSTTTFYEGAVGGIVNSNAIYSAWGTPDPDIVYLVGCSVEIIMEVPLAIKWNYFYVTLNNDIPALSWSAEYDPGTTFEIQRSYDGTNFYNIKAVASEVGRSDYKHDDNTVNTKAPIVYYRIKASEPSGETKYSETRIVRFANKQGAITYTAPNPFTSNFTLTYHAAEKEMLTIRLFNVGGQQKLVKNVMVNNGSNSIRINEAANLASGIYFIQVSSGEKVISSSKIIKQ
jgi:hypothetical protein